MLQASSFCSLLFEQDFLVSESKIRTIGHKQQQWFVSFAIYPVIYLELNGRVECISITDTTPKSNAAITIVYCTIVLRCVTFKFRVGFGCAYVVCNIAMKL